MINENYLKLRGGYLFSEVRDRVLAYQKKNPEAEVISLGIGDVTLPLIPAVLDAIHGAADEMGKSETFHGYAPDFGYGFLRDTIAEKDYRAWGCSIDADEIFISDGAKSDSSNIQEIFSTGCRVALCDPVYSVYLDSNVMAGRAGDYDEASGKWGRIIYMPCTAENHFSPMEPKEEPDLIYLCNPNNPTGTALTRGQMEKWVAYANQVDAVILYDAAYEAFISDADVPHSIFEIEDAKKCAIELRSFSKRAGFTGVRLGFTVIPKELHRDGVSLHSLWGRRHTTKYNGAPYIIQKAGAAVYSESGIRQTAGQIAYYKENAALIRKELMEAGFNVFGGVNAPYIWMKIPEGYTSWGFFDFLLGQFQVVVSPGCGFGPNGEGYIRLTAFGSHESTAEALTRTKRGIAL